MIKTIQTETQHAVTSMGQGMQEVEAGTQLATRAGESLETIGEQIVGVTNMVRQIATAAEEQTATTGEIAQNIQQVASVTQQSARGAQQSVDAAVQLAELSTQLQGLIERFKLDQNGGIPDHALPSQQAALAMVPASTTIYTS